MILICAILVAFLFAMCAWSILKNRNLSKMLKDVPGPTAAPIVGTLMALYTFAGNQDCYAIAEYLTRNYGRHIKLYAGNRPVLLISDSVDTKKYLCDSKSVHKPDIVYECFKCLFRDGLITADGNTWRAHRKILYKLLTNSRIYNHIENFQRKSEKLILKFSENIASDMDIFPLVYRSILEAGNECLIGLDQGNPKGWDQLHASLQTALSIAVLRGANMCLKFDFIFNCLTSLGKTFNTHLVKIRKYTEELSSNRFLQLERQGCDGESNNVIDALFNSCSKNEIYDEVLTFIAASTDTTTSAFCFSLIMLALHPTVQDKLLEEVLEVLGTSSEVNSENINRLQYTRMVIFETLRLFPPAPIIARENCDDVQLSYFTVPANTTVALNFYSMHRDEKYWPDPLSFKPERFSPENSTNKDMGAFMPFAAGPRNCPGANFAILELTVFLANIIRKFKVSTTYKSIQDIQLSFHVVIVPAEGTKCILEPRT